MLNPEEISKYEKVIERREMKDKPIICPDCKREVIPHETYRQRFEDAWNYISDFCQGNEIDNVGAVFEIYFNNLCLDERMYFIQESKKSNIKAIKKDK